MAEILGLKKDILLSDGNIKDFTPHSERDFLEIIMEHHEYLPRTAELEEDESFQQVIPYIWLVNSKGQVFYYVRAEKETGKEYSENRLRRKVSCGVGGHIEKEHEGREDDPIISGMLRELNEEVTFGNSGINNEEFNPDVLGLINCDLQPIDKYHIGLVAVFNIGDLEISKVDREIADYAFVAPDELERVFEDSDVESWTSVSWKHVKEFLRTQVEEKGE